MSDVTKQLVKQRVTKDDPVSKLVQFFSIRHVSGSITLDELSRILVRNRFALVDNTKFVTTNDLLDKLQAPPTPVVEEEETKTEEVPVEAQAK